MLLHKRVVLQSRRRMWQRSYEQMAFSWTTKLSLVRGGWLQKGTFNWLKVICVRYDKEDKVENNKKKIHNERLQWKAPTCAWFTPVIKFLDSSRSDEVDERWWTVTPGREKEKERNGVNGWRGILEPDQATNHNFASVVSQGAVVSSWSSYMLNIYVRSYIYRNKRNRGSGLRSIGWRDCLVAMSIVCHCCYLAVYVKYRWMEYKRSILIHAYSMRFPRYHRRIDACRCSNRKFRIAETLKIECCKRL